MKVSLHTSTLAATAHGAVFLPWLERVARTAAQTRQPTAVLVPLRADAYALKSCALTAGIGLFGIHFLTPGDLRDRLAAHLGLPLRIPLREHARLLLATAAERVAERRADEATAGVAASPDQLLKAIDLVGAAGWDFAREGPPRLRPVVAEYERLLAGAGFAQVHAADRALREQARTAAPHFAELFVIGFNALHWPHWPLLEAGVRAAERAVVCLTDPRDDAAELDAAWIGTWEETFGTSTPIPADPPAPASSIDFLVGRDTAGQARAIVTKALHFLADPACERLGVLFPAAGALPRRVAALLAELDVPHQDGLAHQAPGPLEDPAWPAWLALQESPRVPSLLAFLRTRPSETFAGRPLAEVEDSLTRTFQELLFDDLAVVAEYLGQQTHRRSASDLAMALRALPFLPERAPLGEFRGRTGVLFRELGWETRAVELERVAADWESAGKLVISRRSWLRWLGETLVSWRTERAAAGRHPYSRLHLLPYAQAEAQSWTHLIATSLNEGQWPPRLEDAGFLGEEEIEALNRRLTTLNTRALHQGRQGEGHVAVQPGHALSLGPAQRRALAARQFFNTMDAATVAVAVSASEIDETAPDRPLNPSEFFNHRHFESRGRAVSQATMEALRRETTRWLEASGLWPDPVLDLAAVQPTAAAYQARRAAGQGFGEYGFALHAAPPQPLRLAATQWENALASPALAWMQCLLGVGPGESSDETPWSLATGQWVHHWLAAISAAPVRGAFAARPTAEELSARVAARAHAFRERIAAVLAARGRTTPDWWLSAWEQAWRLAAQLAGRIAEVPGHPHLATERTLPDTAITIAAGVELHVRGRIDLLLAQAPPVGDAWPEEVWIVDYKTGKKLPLTTARLATGDGLQLALYALAARQCGAASAGASVLTPTIALSEPQITLPALATLAGLWRGLHAMQEQAVFGQRGALRGEWSYGGDYPLATLAIDEDLLEEKWALTHPHFAGEATEEPA